MDTLNGDMGTFFSLAPLESAIFVTFCFYIVAFIAVFDVNSCLKTHNLSVDLHKGICL